MKICISCKKEFESISSDFCSTDCLENSMQGLVQGNMKKICMDCGKEFERDNYRPPWLWSVVFLLRKIAATVSDTRIICDPTSGGRERGAHNCGKCDKEILSLISEFSLTQDPSVFDKVPKCDCLNEWNAERAIGVLNLNQGS